MEDNKQGSNWLIAYGLLLFAVIFSITLFMLYSIAYDSFNPMRWNFADSFFFWSLFFTISTSFSFNYLIQKYDIDVGYFINGMFDVFEYHNSDKKPLDCILSHYTNVATIGLFLMTIIYVVKPFIPVVIGLISGFGVAFFCCLIFFIYSLVLFRFFLGLAKRGKYTYYIICPVALLFDMQVITIFIKSVPSVS